MIRYATAEPGPGPASTAFAAERNDYGVIVLDLMMPRIDGLAVVRYIGQYCPEKLGNVIVTTAFGSRALEQVCPPVHHFLEKPFDVSVLVAQALDCCRN